MHRITAPAAATTTTTTIIIIYNQLLVMYLSFYRRRNLSGTVPAFQQKSSLITLSQKASFLAASSPHSGDWLQALPISFCGLVFS